MKYNDPIIAYDTFDNDVLIHECNSMREMAKYFGVSYSTIQSVVKEKGLFKWRYKIVRVELKGENE